MIVWTRQVAAEVMTRRWILDTFLKAEAKDSLRDWMCGSREGGSQGQRQGHSTHNFTCEQLSHLELCDLVRYHPLRGYS